MLKMENTGKSAALFLLFDDTEEGALQFILEKQCFRHILYISVSFLYPLVWYTADINIVVHYAYETGGCRNNGGGLVLRLVTEPRSSAGWNSVQEICCAMTAECGKICAEYVENCGGVAFLSGVLEAYASKSLTGKAQPKRRMKAWRSYTFDMALWGPARPQTP